MTHAGQSGAGRPSPPGVSCRVLPHEPLSPSRRAPTDAVPPAQRPTKPGFLAQPCGLDPFGPRRGLEAHASCETMTAAAVRAADADHARTPRTRSTIDGRLTERQDNRYTLRDGLRVGPL